MKIYQPVNFVFVRLIPLMVSIISMRQMWVNGTVFTYIKFGTLLHALTAIALCTAYVIGCNRLNFLPVPARQIYAMSLVVTGIHLYDVSWGVSSLISRGGPFSWVSLFSLFIASLLLIFLDRQNLFLEPTKLTWMFFIIMIISLGAMSLTGFYSRMTLYDVGIGPDPNVDNRWWVLSKFSGFLVMPFSTHRGYESKEIRWTL